MQCEIRAKDVSISQALCNHIERRLRFALDRFASRIRQVRVKLADPNGPRGGIDRCCKLAISLDRSSTIVMESQASNVYAAIDCIADRAATYIGRRLKRPHGRKTLRPISELLVQESTNVVMLADLQPGGAP